MRKQLTCKYCNKEKIFISARMKREQKKQFISSPTQPWIGRVCPECVLLGIRPPNRKLVALNKYNHKHTCLDCSKTFLGAKHAKYCSPDCSLSYRTKKRKKYPRTISIAKAWVNTPEIIDFYNKCPEGHHVDHIIPINGESVCGLHTLDNLQYLPSSINISKNNKFDGTYENSSWAS